MSRAVASVPGARAAWGRLRSGLRRATGVDGELAQLRDRIGELEAEVQQGRRLNQRVAELTDVVAEVLVPAADRDDDRLRAALTDYRQTTF